MRHLAEGVACDILVNEAEATHAALIAPQLDKQSIDMAIQPIAGRQKSILIADMDSTMIEQECIDELADAVGIKDKVSDITARAMRGEIEFDPALRERVGLLKGCLLYTSPSPRDRQKSRMPSSA